MQSPLINRFIQTSVATVAMLIVANASGQTNAPATPSAAPKAAAAKPAPKKAADKAKTNFCKPETKGTPVKVKLTTTMGAMTLELDSEKAPISVANFIKYVEKGHYDGTVFHRVIGNFMIQGGGFDKDYKQKPTEAQIKNESTNGLKNDVYTVAMARTGVRDSATSQFFINVKNNDFLNFSGENPNGWGYAVFGKVIDGIDIVEKIKAVPTARTQVSEAQPLEPIVIEKAECVQ
jgi:peptidyl-prolyl cis-trans isomerase B (cyclophilin B)